MKPRQLGLQLPPVVALTSDNFFPHSGVQRTIESVEHLAAGHFSISYIYGARRQGCTHLCIYLQDLFQRQNKPVAILSGAHLSEWLQQKFSTISNAPEQIFIIDDADQHFFSTTTSGPFVTFVETCRNHGGHILLFSHRHQRELPNDEHVMSRIFAGNALALEAPADEELSLLLTSLSHQRGITLSDWQARYISRRIGRNIDNLHFYLQCLERTREESSGLAIRQCINRAFDLYQAFPFYTAA